MPEGEEQGMSLDARAEDVHLAWCMDAVGQLTGGDEGGREDDLAGKQAVEGGSAGQAQQEIHRGGLKPPSNAKEGGTRKPRNPP
jgi:hypothetical protein